MDDVMIKALGKNGGVIQINFGSTFVSKLSQNWRNQMTTKRKALVEEAGQDSPLVKTFDEEYAVKNPFPFASVDTVLDHIDHVVELIGIDHVGIGSDYDGVGDSLPEGLKDVSSYPNLVQGLLDRNYSEADIKKILSGNFLRVWQAVETYADKH